jgi:SAM-dependent methyltransferase
VSSAVILPTSRDGSDADDVVFDQFLAEVARAQLEAWLPPGPSLVLDLSLNCARHVGLMVSRGHTVVHADPTVARPDICGAELVAPAGGGRLVTVRADSRRLDWLADSSVDALVAEGSVLSESLATEVTLDDIHRVLRPGGRLLMCVDSLVSGLSRLADQGCWAELADVPAADVVLVPDGEGHVSRCFWPEEVHGMLTQAGFEVEWIRPRTVLAEQTVVRALRFDRTRMASLVSTELGLSRSRQGESIGARLVASAVRT